MLSSTMSRNLRKWPVSKDRRVFFELIHSCCHEAASPTISRRRSRPHCSRPHEANDVLDLIHHRLGDRTGTRGPVGKDAVDFGRIAHKTLGLRPDGTEARTA